MRIVFEGIPCSRCGGTGRMPYSAYDGVCFKCSGNGRVLTKAGKTARALYVEAIARLTQVDPMQLVVGDCYRTAAHNLRERLTLVEPPVQRPSLNQFKRDGDWVTCADDVILVSKKMTLHTTVGELVYRLPTEAQMAEAVAEVLKARKRCKRPGLEIMTAPEVSGLAEPANIG